MPGKFDSPIYPAAIAFAEGHFEAASVTEQIQQAAASSGEDGANSGVVQQQIAAQVAQLNTQRQEL
jgi:hypothetical protein